MKLFKPTNYAMNQNFGENFNSIYATLGWKGHNGIDFACPTGTPFYWNCDQPGKVERIYWDNLGGNALFISFQDGIKNYKQEFYHNQKFNVIFNQTVYVGQLLGYTDNTGEGTSGSHLHALTVKELGKDSNGNWITLNKDNGYGGALNPNLIGYAGVFAVDYRNQLEAQLGIIQRLLIFLKELLKLI